MQGIIDYSGKELHWNLAEKEFQKFIWVKPDLKE